MSHQLLKQIPAPAIPTASNEYTRSREDQLRDVLRLYFRQTSSVLNSLTMVQGGRHLEVPYGVFYDTTDQALDTINVAQSVVFGAEVYDYGIVVAGTPAAEITVTYGGIYNIQFSGRLVSGSGSTKTAWVWLDRNGSNIANTTREYVIAGAGQSVEVSQSRSIMLHAGEYVRVMWTGDDIDLTLEASAASSPIQRFLQRSSR